MLELWGVLSTPSLPSLPGPLWPEVVAPNRTKLCIYVDQIELNCVFMLNWIIWNRTVFGEWNCFFMLNWIVWNRIVYMYKNLFGINNLQWLICDKTKPNQTKPKLTVKSSYKKKEEKKIFLGHPLKNKNKNKTKQTRNTFFTGKGSWNINQFGHENKFKFISPWAIIRSFNPFWLAHSITSKIIDV